MESEIRILYSIGWLDIFHSTSKKELTRFLGVSNVSVLNWIRSFGKEVQDLNSDSQEIEMVEVDEMHSYVGSKKTIVGYGLLLIDMGKDSSISLLATEATKRQKSFGKR